MPVLSLNKQLFGSKARGFEFVMLQFCYQQMKKEKENTQEIPRALNAWQACTCNCNFNTFWFIQRGSFISFKSEYWMHWYFLPFLKSLQLRIQWQPEPWPWLLLRSDTYKKHPCLYSYNCPCKCQYLTFTRWHTVNISHFAVYSTRDIQHVHSLNWGR